MPNWTDDHWGLGLIAPVWPDYRVLLIPPSGWTHHPLEKGIQVAADEEIIAYGFSETGKSFIVATILELMMFSR